MKKTIGAEAVEDKENFDWCKEERKTQNKNLDDKNDEITKLQGECDELKVDIVDPQTGLKKQIEDTETNLLQNQRDQDTMVKNRKEEHAAYQKDVSHLSDAEDLLNNAIAVLSKYYTQLEKTELVGTSFSQIHRGDAAPATFDEFKGQSGNGNKAVEMLQFILGETKTEHTEADKTEKDAKKDFEDGQTKLKETKMKEQIKLVKVEAQLTEEQKQLLDKRSDLKDTTSSKLAIEAYLLQIKPGCDFINTNFKLREGNRGRETTALEKADELIKDTSAYKAAVA